MRRYKFKIGDVVTVAAVAVFNYYKHEADTGGTSARVVEQEPLDAPKIGQIIGMRYRRLGTYTPGCADEPAEFWAHTNVRVWLVATSLMGKPLEALEEDVALYSLPFRLPNTSFSVDARMREVLRREAAATPRVNGKFASPTPNGPWHKGMAQWRTVEHTKL